jgi:hypothetical protein
VSGDTNPRDADLDEVNARLSDGLKACRSMVANYKALLKPDEEAGETAEDAESDESDPPGPAAPEST